MLVSNLKIPQITQQFLDMKTVYYKMFAEDSELGWLEDHDFTVNITNS
jgi:hypothetical protein